MKMIKINDIVKVNFTKAFMLQIIVLIIYIITITYLYIIPNISNMLQNLEAKVEGKKSELVAMAYEGNVDAIKLILERINSKTEKAFVTYYQEKQKMGMLSKSLDLELAGDYLGTLSLKVESVEFARVLFFNIVLLLALFIANFYFYNFVTRNFNEKIVEPLIDVNTKIGEADRLSEISFENESLIGIVELKNIISTLKSSLRKIEQAEKQIKENEILSERDAMFKKVSHDIRSPLTALNMVMASLDELPEETRLITRTAIQRIQDIANNLLSQTSVKETFNKRSVFLLPCVDEIISEKRIEFRGKSSVLIRGSFKNDESAFAEVDEVELKQIISNIINNSVEAMENNEGEVEVCLNKNKSHAIIEIKDNGVGIPASVIKKIGEKEFSYGKEKIERAGSGLGVYNAIKTVKGWGGEFEIQSVEGKGSTVAVRLPLVKHPKWFLDSILIKRNKKILVLDDDEDIHNIWKGRLKSVSDRCVHLYSLDEAKSWFLDYGKGDNFILFSDYEFIGEKSNGLEFIKELGIERYSVLVTSHFSERSLQETASSLQLKILPKFMVHNFNLKIEEEAKT